MQWKREHGKIKICPRCGLQYMEGLESCPDCGLIFSRLDIATNADAKKKIKRHDFDFIIKTNKLPSDVSFLKLLLYSICLGYLGGHCFYVGRYIRGSIILIDFLCIMCLTMFNNDIASVGNGALLGTLSTVCGLILLMWLWDIIMIATKRFKVPVAIDLVSENAFNKEQQIQREKFLNEYNEIKTQSLTKEENSKQDIAIKNDDEIQGDVNKEDIDSQIHEQEKDDSLNNDTSNKKE